MPARGKLSAMAWLHKALTHPAGVPLYLVQKPRPTPTIAIRANAACDRQDMGWLVLRRGLGARRIAVSVSQCCWPYLYPARIFFAFSTRVLGQRPRTWVRMSYIAVNN